MERADAFIAKIQEMFAQVNATIKQMLSNLTYIYQSHGIRYRVDDKFDFVLRLLTPFEILNYFQMRSIENLLDQEGKYWVLQLNKQLYIRQGQEREQLNQNIKIKGNSILANSDSISNDRNIEKGKKLRSNKITKERQIKKGPPPPHKGSLTIEQEQKISAWIKLNAKKGHKVSKSDVITQANIFSKGVCTSGWARGFFFRYPGLQKYIKRAKLSQRQKITFMTRGEEIVSKLSYYDQSCSQQRQETDHNQFIQINGSDQDSELSQKLQGSLQQENHFQDSQDNE